MKKARILLIIIAISVITSIFIPKSSAEPYGPSFYAQRVSVVPFVNVHGTDFYGHDTIVCRIFLTESFYTFGRTANSGYSGNEKIFQITNDRCTGWVNFKKLSWMISFPTK